MLANEIRLYSSPTQDRRTRPKLTGELIKGLDRIPSTTIRVNQAKLNIISRVPLFDYHNTVAPHNTKPIKIRYYPNLWNQ